LRALRDAPRTRTLAIIADTHLPRGDRRLPDGCLQRLRKADLILHAGDISSSAALAELRAIGPPVLAVHGNVDEPALKESLPPVLEQTIGGARIAMLHDAGSAAGRLQRLRARFPGCAAVLFGHSHIPLHERVEDFQIFNPGSPTDRRRQPQRTMGLARVQAGAIAFELVNLGR
jgi:putative phosphoesterase